MSAIDADEFSTVHGFNPQNLIEKIIRNRIFSSIYWKEHCFGLNAAQLVDKAVNLKYAGGVFGGHLKPTPFLCLVMKMLMIQPEKEIVLEFLKNEDFKYIRLLAAVYIRLTYPSVDVYKYLEQLYSDNRKITYRKYDGTFVKMYIDEFIDHLLTEERFCDIILPRLTKRSALEDLGKLGPRKSALDAELEEESEEEEKSSKESESESESDSDSDSESSSFSVEEYRKRKRELEEMNEGDEE